MARPPESARPEAIRRWGEVRALAALLWRLAQARLFVGPGTVGAMCVVVDDAGQVLLVKARYRRWWGVPGGYGDPGEDPRHTAARETREETGVVLADEPVELARRRRGSHLDVLCLARAASGPSSTSATAPTSWEIAAVRWVDPHRPGVRMHPVCDAALALVPGGLAGAAVSADHRIG